MAAIDVEFDFSKRLEIKINNQKPVGLADLTLSLLAINHQFQRFIEIDSTEDYKPATDLYIKEVRAGSIIVDLVTQAMPIVPMVWNGAALSEWVDQAKAIIEWLLGTLDKPPRELTKQDLSQWQQILEPVARDSASQYNFVVKDGGTVINQVIVGSQEANAIQNRIRREIDVLESPSQNIHLRKVMYWKQAKFDRESNTGNKAVIDSISARPLKVIFENNAVRDAMFAGDERFHKSWQQLAYVVDVEVETVRNEPKVYKVIRYHADDTFDPEA